MTNRGGTTRIMAATTEVSRDQQRRDDEGFGSDDGGVTRLTEEGRRRFWRWRRWCRKVTNVRTTKMLVVVALVPRGQQGQGSDNFSSGSSGIA